MKHRMQTNWQATVRPREPGTSHSFEIVKNLLAGFNGLIAPGNINSYCQTSDNLILMDDPSCKVEDNGPLHQIQCQLDTVRQEKGTEHKSKPLNIVIPVIIALVGVAAVFCIVRWNCKRQQPKKMNPVKDEPSSSPALEAKIARIHRENQNMFQKGPLINREQSTHNIHRSIGKKTDWSMYCEYQENGPGRRTENEDFDECYLHQNGPLNIHESIGEYSDWSMYCESQENGPGQSSENEDFDKCYLHQNGRLHICESIGKKF